MLDVPWSIIIWWCIGHNKKNKTLIRLYQPELMEDTPYLHHGRTMDISWRFCRPQDVRSVLYGEYIFEAPRSRNPDVAFVILVVTEAMRTATGAANGSEVVVMTDLEFYRGGTHLCHLLGLLLFGLNCCGFYMSHDMIPQRTEYMSLVRSTWNTLYLSLTRLLTMPVKQVLSNLFHRSTS